jgi:hypothetical protein
MVLYKVLMLKLYSKIIINYQLKIVKTRQCQLLLKFPEFHNHTVKKGLLFKKF